MARFKVGVQLYQQHTTIRDLRYAWQKADALGVDSISCWDHFFPLFDDGSESHFEGWSLVTAMAMDTEQAQIGTMVTCNSYRNPDLLADIARTVDHLSNGRVFLGIGSGWFAQDYEEYGYEFGTAGSRLKDLEWGLERIKSRLAKLNPKPIGKMPILIGGAGEKVTLRLVAEHADAWNTFGPPEHYAHKSQILDEWCEKVGRDPKSIERTVSVNRRTPIEPDGDDTIEDYLALGAQQIIVGVGHPFDFTTLEYILKMARG